MCIVDLSLGIARKDNTDKLYRDCKVHLMQMHVLVIKISYLVLN